MLRWIALTGAAVAMHIDQALVGTWKLRSCILEDIDTGEQKLVWGANPNGYIVVSMEGRWIVIQTAEGRRAPGSDEDRVAAFKSLLAYSGRCRTEGSKIVISVDISADESWNGTEQTRFYNIDGRQLYIEAPPQRYANFGDKMMRGILVWQRE